MRIQIYVAICTYRLVTIVKNDMKLERSTYEVLQILSISLTDKTHLKDLFDKTKFQYDKDHFGPNGPNLFNVQLVPHFYGTLMSHFYSFFNSLSFKLNNLRSCLNLYRQVFYRAKIECLFVFRRARSGLRNREKERNRHF